MNFNQLKEFISNGPYDHGFSVIRHKGKTTKTTLFSKSYEEYKQKLAKANYFIWTIKQGYEGRPDIIASEFLGDPSFFWIILEVNNIADPFEELNIGQKIRIPKEI